MYVGVQKDSKPESPAVVVNEISKEKLEESGVQTAAAALEKVAGIDTRNFDKGQNSISVRGFDQQSIKVLIDGVPAYELYYGLVDLSVIPAESIEKIVVTKGASSVLYGPNTMGGVVNIITKKGDGKSKTTLATSYGDAKAFNYGLNHGMKIGKFKYNINYSNKSADGWVLSRKFNKNNTKTGIGTDYREDGGIRENSDYKKQSFVGNLGYEPTAAFKTNLSINWLNQLKGCPIQNMMGTAQLARFTDWNQWQVSLAGENTLKLIS